MDQKKEKLINYIKNLGPTLIAFSGGTDSSLLAYLAKRFCKEPIAVTINSPLLSKKELDKSKEIAGQIGICHKILNYNPLNIKAFKSNPKNRCYLCKKYIFLKIVKYKKRIGFTSIIDGTNYDDLGKYRPGIKALKELRIKSPFAENKIYKSDIKDWLLEAGLNSFISPSSACLASRIPYNTNINTKKLNMVEMGEDILHDLGFKDVRIRNHFPIAIIEIKKEQINKLLNQEIKYNIIAKLKKIGFSYITVDLEGFRSGSLDENS